MALRPRLAEAGAIEAMVAVATREGSTSTERTNAADILADSSKYHPTTRETADHSLPYCLAALVLDGCLTPDQFTPERMLSPDILALMPRITVVAEPRYESLFPALKPAGIRIVLKDGRVLESEVEYPKGDYRNPLTDDEIVTKIAPMMLAHMPRERLDSIVEAVWRLEHCADIGRLMDLLSGRRQQTL